jgi:hypothetical protein
MTTPILYPGDSIHVVLPSTGSEREDNRIIQEMRTTYARCGVNLLVGTAATGATFQVLAIFRKPILIPVEDQ